MEEHLAIADAFHEADQELLERAVKNHFIMFKENILKSDFLSENQ